MRAEVIGRAFTSHIWVGTARTIASHIWIKKEANDVLNVLQTSSFSNYSTCTGVDKCFSKRVTWSGF
jgi:hypothetical protein